MSTERLLVARVGAEHFAFPLAAVLEALDGTAVQPLPLMPAGVMGQCAYRGALLPVLDPRVALGAPAVGADCMLLVMVADEPFGIAMDDLTDMVTVGPSARRPMPAGADRGGLLTGLLAQDGVLAGIVDLAALRATASSLLSPETP